MTLPGKYPTSRRPVTSMETLHQGKILGSALMARSKVERSNPDANYGLGIAKVINVDYEEFYLTLRTVIGTAGEYDRIPIPLSFPGAGTRHFLGAMPQVGDYCVVGWMPPESQSTKKGTKIPVVLSWVVPGVWPGREWLTTAAFPSEEFDSDSPKDRELMHGVFDRIRHKLRHIHPGEIVASSAQGSDMVLDEGVTLANRRGNEFRLRDQDQAAVTRALQRFDALAGTRLYAGMVQRDALTLPTSMVSDGFEWDSGSQAINREPQRDDQLPVDNVLKEGFLTPASPFSRKPGGTDGLGASPYPIEENLDPYTVLRRGGFITEDGYVVDDRHQGDAVYGGKPLFRVSHGSADNMVLDADQRALSEYRIEVTHTSDGRLPVTEQTDMFDAERLPNTDIGSQSKLNPNAPFIESVLGSVVGNDPFSVQGRKNYGLPQRVVIFDGDVPAPRMEAAKLVSDPDVDTPTPLSEHAATLFRLSPPLATNESDTFWSLNKKGQFKASIGGNPQENSVEAFLQGGLKLGLGGAFQLLMDGDIALRTKSKGSFEVSSDEGPVKIYGGGPVKDSTPMVERLSGTGRGEADAPSVQITAKTNAWIHANKRIEVKGNEVELLGPSVRLTGTGNVGVNAVKNLGLSGETVTMGVSGKRQDSYSGPKGLLSSNGPLHERTYAPNFPGGTALETTFVYGDRKETFRLGNHSTDILVGDMSYTTKLGKFKAQAVGSSLELGVTGISGTAQVGTVSLSAVAGSMSMSGLMGVTILSGAGPVAIKSAQSVYLGAPITGSELGPIMCAGTREPFTNLPYTTWNLGAKAHRLGP